MKEINQQLDQLSGHLAIIAIPLYNIRSIQGSVIEFYNPGNNYELNCSKESIAYSCHFNHSKAGASIEHKIFANVSGRSGYNDQILEEMLFYQFLVIIQNADGNFTRIGNICNGLDFTFEFSTSRDPSLPIFYQLFFQGITLETQKDIKYI